MHVVAFTMGTSRCRGFSMVEVLITLVILAFGLMGLVNLQIKLQMNEVESYQRGQAVVLLEDMAGRMRVGSLTPTDADLDGVYDDVGRLATYITGNDWLGVDSTIECDDRPAGAPATDCDAWDSLLKGAAVEDGGANLGAMVGARGCIGQIDAGDPTNGVCRAAMYRVSVAWQGLFESAAPTEGCGSGEYGDKEGYRRAISTIVLVGAPQCLPL